MTRQKAIQIIQEERLNHYNMYEQRPHKIDELGIQKTGNQWVVYYVGERANVEPGTEFYFDSEEEALDQFIRRLQAGNKLRRLLKD